MAAYRRVYDSCHLQADCQEQELQNPTFGNRVWATFTFYYMFWAIVQGRGCGGQKRNFKTKFQVTNAIQGRIPCIYQIFRTCGDLYTRSTVNIW